MKLKFSKYQGTGNDFIILDRFSDTSNDFDFLEEEIALLCDRRFGIGADGLIIIQKHPDYDFEMIYYNSDGNVSSMCGNGGRCIVHYAFSKSYVGKNCRFLAIDGEHKAKASADEISLQMKDVETVKRDGSAYVLDTGSPHYVYLSKIPEDKEFIAYAKEVRYGEIYHTKGINVNCLEKTGDDVLEVLTYERGVEDITFSCGTGVVAAAITQSIYEKQKENFNYKILTKGGALKVSGNISEGKFHDIWLIGPAMHVYEGLFNLQKKHQDFPKLH